MEIPDKLHQRAAIIANMRPLRTPIRTIYNENDLIEAKSSTSATATKKNPALLPPPPLPEIQLMMISFSQHEQKITLIYSFFIIK